MTRQEIKKMKKLLKDKIKQGVELKSSKWTTVTVEY